jgi:hypothetical protein
MAKISGIAFGRMLKTCRLTAGQVWRVSLAGVLFTNESQPELTPLFFLTSWNIEGFMVAGSPDFCNGFIWIFW